MTPAQPSELAAGDWDVSPSLESVLSDNTRRTFDTQWRVFDGWRDEVGLGSLPAEPFTLARYLAARGNSGAFITTLRLVISAVSKAHEWAELESHCRDPGVALLVNEGRNGTLPNPSGSPAPSPPINPAGVVAASRRPSRPSKGRGSTWPRGGAHLGRRAAWEDSSGRITLVRSKIDA